MRRIRPEIRLLAASSKRLASVRWNSGGGGGGGGGGGSSDNAGSINQAGGSLGKKEQAQEGQYFKKLQQDLVNKMKEKKQVAEDELKKGKDKFDKAMEDLDKKK